MWLLWTWSSSSGIYIYIYKQDEIFLGPYFRAVRRGWISQEARIRFLRALTLDPKVKNNHHKKLSFSRTTMKSPLFDMGYTKKGRGGCVIVLIKNFLWILHNVLGILVMKYFNLGYQDSNEWFIHAIILLSLSVCLFLLERRYISAIISSGWCKIMNSYKNY